MVQSQATTVKGYLAELPPDRRNVVAAVRKIILDNLPAGYEEGMQYGMIGYFVPLKIYPEGYLDNPSVPLCYAALAAQKNYFSLYLMTIYSNQGSETWFKKAWQKTGKKLDMGKSCLRFKKLEDLSLDLISQVIARTPVPDYIALYETARKK